MSQLTDEAARKDLMNRLKRAPAALPEHAGTGERGLIVSAGAQADGNCRVGLINPRRKLGLELVYPAMALPRLAHWQHFGPRGSYVTALEPFYGSLLGRARDCHATVDSMLAPGESRFYSLRLRVLRTTSDFAQLASCDGTVEPAEKCDRPRQLPPA